MPMFMTLFGFLRTTAINNQRGKLRETNFEKIAFDIIGKVCGDPKNLLKFAPSILKNPVFNVEQVNDDRNLAFLIST